jgi:hypothetical protein
MACDDLRHPAAVQMEMQDRDKHDASAHKYTAIEAAGRGRVDGPLRLWIQYRLMGAAFRDDLRSWGMILSGSFIRSD